MDTYRGLNILIGYNVPLASGLSSSSSFVVCASILAVFANQSLINSKDLLANIITYERNLGTAIGGMD